MSSVNDRSDSLPSNHPLAELLARGQLQLAANEAATERAFGFGAGTMRRWRREGKGPRYSKPIEDGHVYYLFSDVVTWLHASSYASRAEEVSRG